MLKNNYIVKHRKGLTLLEMVISLAIMIVIMSAMLPQIVAINKSWDSRIHSSEALQNGRVLVDHINYNLATAVRIIDVSEPATVNGFLEFEDNNSDIYRYEVSAGNMVQFGLVGSLSDLAGPVSNFQFTCYDDNDLDTPLVIATDGVEGIRYVSTDITVINSAPLGQDKDLVAGAYLRTSVSVGEAEVGLVGHWKLDETFGTTAADSSGLGNNGTLTNMAGSEWTTGIVDGALDFDGLNDYVNYTGGSLNITDEITVSAWVWHDAFIISNVERYVTVVPEIAVIRKDSNDQLHFYIKTGGTLKHLWSDVLTEGQWQHIAGTWDGTTQRLYFNGAEIDSQAPGGVLDGTVSSVSLSASGGTLNGLLDDVRIYNRALSPEEVAALDGTLRMREFTEARTGSTAANSITISTPSGTVEDDLLIAAVTVRGDNSASLSPPAGENWTAIYIGDRAGEVTLGVWWKLAYPSESPSHQFTWTESTQESYAWIMRFTGHDVSDPINDDSYNSGYLTDPTSPSVTTTVDDCLILRIGGFNNADIITDNPGLTDHTAITMDASSISASGAYGVSVTTELEFKGNTLLDGVSGQPTITTNTILNNRVMFKNATIVNADILIGPGGVVGTVFRYYNPFTGQFNGTAGPLDAVVDIPSSIAEPGLGASIGDVVYSSGTTIINSDIHCDTLTIDGTAIIQIDGNVTILVEGNVLVTDDTEIQLLAGATLDFYAKAQTWFRGNSQINVNTADPARFRIYHIAPGGIETMMNFKGFCTAYVQMHAPTSSWVRCMGNSEVYGTFQGKQFGVAEFGTFHVDFGSAGGGGGGDPVSGGAGYTYKSSAGFTGTSNFALTAINEFCTVTIAIKPGSQGPIGGGEIIP